MSWESVRLEDVCVSIADGDHQALPLAESGIPFIVIADINGNNRIDFERARYVPEDYYEKLDPRRKPQRGDVLLTVKGSFGIPVYVDGSNVYYVYEFLRNATGEIVALRKGSAQPHVYAKDINSLQAIIPNERLFSLFADVVAPFFEKITMLERQRKAAQEARDRLLPKLMSGEVEV